MSFCKVLFFTHDRKSNELENYCIVIYKYVCIQGDFTEIVSFFFLRLTNYTVISMSSLWCILKKNFFVLDYFTKGSYKKQRMRQNSNNNITLLYIYI